jgi:hypothetical protein
MKAKITFGIAIFILVCSFSSMAQMTAYANIYAEVIAPIGIGKSTDLTINQTIVGQKNVSGTAASFSVKGSSLNTFDVTLPQEVYTINNGEGKMTVSNFTTSVVSANTPQNKASVISINATLNVSGTLTAGNYNAQNPFQVTLNYN